MVLRTRRLPLAQFLPIDVHYRVPMESQHHYYAAQLYHEVQAQHLELAVPDLRCESLGFMSTQQPYESKLLTCGATQVCFADGLATGGLLALICGERNSSTQTRSGNPGIFHSKPAGRGQTRRHLTLSVLSIATLSSYIQTIT